MLLWLTKIVGVLVGEAVRAVSGCDASPGMYQRYKQQQCQSLAIACQPKRYMSQIVVSVICTYFEWCVVVVLLRLSH
jgi:hypothetical protein